MLSFIDATLSLLIPLRSETIFSASFLLKSDLLKKIIGVVGPEEIESAGLVFVGKDGTGQRCEIFELKDHPYYVGVQFHPEFKSRPGRPSPPFLGLLLASSGQSLD